MLNRSTIRLFKALPIQSRRAKKPTKELLDKTIKKGFVFSPEVVYNYSNYNALIKLIKEEYGISGEQLNNSFHKSWSKIRDSSHEQLLTEQIIHYMTTYGLERVGLYSESTVFIPNEKLEIPNLEDDIKLVVIKGYTKDELKEKVLSMVNSGIALKEETINDLLEVIKFTGLSTEEFESTKNKELKIRLCDEFGLTPNNPTEFLRYVIYKSTGKTLIIKNKRTIEEIKNKNNKDITKLFKRYKTEHNLKRLGEIFYRFKPLFLAYKSNPSLRPTINKIRKLANKYHKPMKEDYLNTITGMLRNNQAINKTKLNKELSECNTFRKIRLAYALKFRTTDADSIVYKIRNGKSYSTEFNFNQSNAAKRVLGIVLDSIVKDVRENVKGKKVYLPDDLNYTLPATEKQFTGNLPSGSSVTVSKDMLFGVHWGQKTGSREDLDLSLINADIGKIGWDAQYKSDNQNILFSGDMTSAPKPKGATELFYIKRQKLGSFILFLNYYNFDEGKDLPFKTIVAQEKVSRLKMNHMVDPNNVKAIAKSTINERQKVLGLLVTTTKDCKFYFSESYMGNSITSSDNEYTEYARKYLFNFYRNAISLKEILEKAGAKFVKKPTNCDINLSYEELEKDTIINLLK